MRATSASWIWDTNSC